MDPDDSSLACHSQFVQAFHNVRDLPNPMQARTVLCLMGLCRPGARAKRVLFAVVCVLFRASFVSVRPVLYLFRWQFLRPFYHLHPQRTGLSALSAQLMPACRPRPEFSYPLAELCASSWYAKEQASCCETRSRAPRQYAEILRLGPYYRLVRHRIQLSKCLVTNLGTRRTSALAGWLVE